jgi:iron complex outermembrane receptor protein
MGTGIMAGGARRGLGRAPLVAVALLYVGVSISPAEELLSLEQSSSHSSVNNLANLSLEDLMNLEVTSVSKTRQRIAEAPAAVTVITQEDIVHSGLREIPELLRLSPGLFVQRGNQLTGWSVSSRGFSDMFANKLLVLQDGRTLYTPLFSGVYWNTVDYPTADLDRIEVIRGPGATLWGANAVNGVINITTKSARDTQGALVDSRLGTESSDLAVRYGGKIDADTFYRIYAKGRAFDDLDYAPNPAGEANQWQDSRGGFRIDRYIGDTDTFTLQGDVFYQSARNNIVTGFAIPGYENDYRSGENLLARWTHVVSDTSEYSLQLYYDRISFRDAFADSQVNTFDIDFQHRFQPIPDHEFIYGLGARVLTDKNRSEELAEPIVEPDSRTMYILNAFVQDTMAIVPERLHLTLGTKLEQNAFTGFEVQPNARLLWTPDEHNSAWIAFSRAVRVPSRWQEDNSIRVEEPIGPGQTGLIVGGSEKPRSEELFAYEVGYRHEVNKSFSIDLTGFANVYGDLIIQQNRGAAFVPTPTPHLEIRNAWVNGMSAETYGLEAAAKWQVTGNWRVSAAYSLLAMFVHEDKSDIRPSDFAIESASPRNQIQVHSYWDVTPKLSLNASAYYVEGIGGDNVIINPAADPASYIRLDLGVVWQPTPGMELSLGVQNLCDPHHLEAPFGGSSSAEVDRAAYAQFTFRY